MVLHCSWDDLVEVKQSVNCFAAQILEMIPDYVLTTINLSDLKNLRILYFVTFAKYVNAGTGCDMYF